MKKLCFVLLCSIYLLSLNGCEEIIESILFDQPDFNDHGAVDLGLPSGIWWATCNIGAERNTEKGDLFAWGETVAKSSTYGKWGFYKYGKGEHQLTKYCTLAEFSKDGFVDNDTILKLMDDAAHVNWGGDWRMPTHQDFQELINECNWEWVVYDRVGGYKVSSKTKKNKSIFLPATYGYIDELKTNTCAKYYSSTIVADNPAYAYYLEFDNQNRIACFANSRCYVWSIRPVCDKKH